MAWSTAETLYPILLNTDQVIAKGPRSFRHLLDTLGARIRLHIRLLSHVVQFFGSQGRNVCNQYDKKSESSEIFVLEIH